MNDGRVIPVTAEDTAAFVAYCRAYGAEHDESYLPQDDFVPTDTHPAYLLVSRRQGAGEPAGIQTTTGESVLGAACLIRDHAYVRQRLARFMILHALKPSPGAYGALLAALVPHVADLDYGFGFIPEQLVEVRNAWEMLGLQVERYVYVMEHPGTASPPVEVPDGYRFRNVSASDRQALGAICELLNLGFAGYPQRVDATPDGLVRDLTGPCGLHDGLMLLYDAGGRPVATVRVELDEAPGAAAISGLVVHPAERGRGLGRAVLRQALRTAYGHGKRPVYLSVATGNAPAIRLYVGEGFRKSQAMVCYRWRPGELRSG